MKDKATESVIEAARYVVESSYLTEGEPWNDWYRQIKPSLSKLKASLKRYDKVSKQKE